MSRQQDVSSKRWDGNRSPFFDAGTASGQRLIISSGRVPDTFANA